MGDVTAAVSTEAADSALDLRFLPEVTAAAVFLLYRAARAAEISA